ncbi:MAG: hypothetical protein OXT74_18035 [Candidatus Poribacteria bacterium]|nr:hypothetical protein [Candidatus Poribacteria bacterium]
MFPGNDGRFHRCSHIIGVAAWFRLSTGFFRTATDDNRVHSPGYYNPKRGTGWIFTNPVE